MMRILLKRQVQVSKCCCEFYHLVTAGRASAKPKKKEGNIIDPDSSSDLKEALEVSFNIFIIYNVLVFRYVITLYHNL